MIFYDFVRICSRKILGVISELTHDLQNLMMEQCLSLTFIIYVLITQNLLLNE